WAKVPPILPAPTSAILLRAMEAPSGRLCALLDVLDGAVPQSGKRVRVGAVLPFFTPQGKGQGRTRGGRKGNVTGCGEIRGATPYQGMVSRGTTMRIEIEYCRR